TFLPHLLLPCAAIISLVFWNVLFFLFSPSYIIYYRIDKARHILYVFLTHFKLTCLQIVNYLKKLEIKYPKTIGISSLTFQTFQGRSVAFVRLSNPYSSNKKPVIIVEAGIHGREWIAPAATLWVMEKILENYESREPTARLMLNKYDWFVVPVTNPDGYEYTHTKDRLWTKNRRYISKGCTGVDLNRNFDIMFGTTDVEYRNKCNTDTYPGESAFSEPESSNIQDLFDSLFQRVVAFVSVHSFGQFVLVPWSYTNYEYTSTSNEDLDRVAYLMTYAISKRHGRLYSYGNSFQKLKYAVAGNSIDWVLKRKPNVYSVSLKLRPSISAKDGFLLPGSQIIPTGEEFYDSL
ncbi:unnamed protein product, partial [Candidula unifasciata]